MARKFKISSSGVSTWFESLNDREKKFVAIFGLLLVLILVGGIFFFVYSKGNERREEIDAMQKMSAEIEKLRPDYASAKSKNEALEAKLLRNRTNFNADMLAAARSAGVTVPIESRSPSGKEGTKRIKDKNIVEERVLMQTVNFGNPISIDRLTSFLSAIEGPQSGGVTKIMSMTVRASPRTPDLLDVTSVTVSTWNSRQG